MGTREFRVVFRERPNESDTDLKECESVVKRWWRVHVVKDSKLGELRRVGMQQEQVIGTYVYSQKHNYIPYSTFIITTVQLHVSAINVGHLQVVHEAPYDKLYLHSNTQPFAASQ